MSRHFTPIIINILVTLRNYSITDIHKSCPSIFHESFRTDTNTNTKTMNKVVIWYIVNEAFVFHPYDKGLETWCECRFVGHGR